MSDREIRSVAVGDGYGYVRIADRINIDMNRALGSIVIQGNAVEFSPMFTNGLRRELARIRATIAANVGHADLSHSVRLRLRSVLVTECGIVATEVALFKFFIFGIHFCCLLLGCYV